jgi:iron complex transport system substrate-binding protein
MSTFLLFMILCSALSLERNEYGCPYDGNVASAVDSKGQPTGAPSSGGGTRIFEDDLKRKVFLEHIPERIISLAPNVTEILFSLDLADKIVGVTTHCDYPEEARQLPKIGDFSHPNLERIVGLDPDLVILTALEQEHLVKDLGTLGLIAFVMYPEDITALLEDIRILGEILGKREKARALLSTMKRRLERVEGTYRAVPHAARPALFCEISANPLMTVSDNSFLGSVLKAAGGRNVMGTLPRRYCRISPESVIEKNPDYIVVAHEHITALELSERIGWGQIDAVKKHNIIVDIDPDLLVRAGPRVIDGIEMLSRRFHQSSGMPQ